MVSCWFSGVALVVATRRWIVTAILMASTKRIHRVFQQTASCTHQRHRWEGQHPFACLGVSYLRTVIVTAAVYRGLGSELCWAEAQLTLPLNLPAPGRRQSVYGALRLSTLLCF